MARCRKASVGVVALVVVLAACGWGETKPVRNVTDQAAQLTGSVHNTVTGPTSYWFEYGKTTGYGSSTPHRSLNVADVDKGYPVSEPVIGLDEGTTYHSKLCATGADGKGICGGDQTFATTQGRDSVTGNGYVIVIPQIGYAIGAELSGVSSSSGGANPVGDAKTGPGSYYFKIPDQGPVTCLRVDGNRAAIGFMVQPPDGIAPPDAQPFPKLIFIEDNGPTGDRFGVGSVADPTTCPAATDASFTSFNVGGQMIPPVITSGDFVVHDHAAP
jgi:hypothetical protein